MALSPPGTQQLSRTLATHYLLGAESIAYTDNIATRHIRTSQHLSSRQIRWLQVIERYNIDIRHIPGVANKAADTLPRLHLVLEGDDTEEMHRENNNDENNGEMHG